MGDEPYVTIRARRPVEDPDSQTGQQANPSSSRAATHDTSRVNYHVKHLGQFAQTLEDSAGRAFPNRGRSSQRYSKVQALLLHWRSDDLFVLPELEDLEKCLREDYAVETDKYAIPSENSHLELMLRIGQLIKDHESQDTLFVIYYGGHARIDESRQSRWCATRHPDSPWLQWSAIQTLLERSISDVLILLDCCAGAASATFPNGNSITETISASSWDAIAPHPGRYSFTDALIEVLQEWRMRTFSAAMLHAELLARLKHPRPININGKHYEARSTPVHFMMTTNHRAPSIELCRIIPLEHRPPSPPDERLIRPGRGPEMGSAPTEQHPVTTDGEGSELPAVFSEPNEDVPHVMITLALEDDQRLDLNAWEQWLAGFPALAKYVKVQGVFKSHSTLMLLSMPVMVWDMLPEDNATSFVAFIRSNNFVSKKALPEPVAVAASSASPHSVDDRRASSYFDFDDNTTIIPLETTNSLGNFARQESDYSNMPHDADEEPQSRRPDFPRGISRTMVYNTHRSARFTTFSGSAAEPPDFSTHVQARLEEYFQHDPRPNDARREFIASNLGLDTQHVEAWFHHRRERDVLRNQLQSLRVDDAGPSRSEDIRMVLPADLDELLRLSIPEQLLVIDLRSPAEFERAHIQAAVNLRVPIQILDQEPLEIIERAFADEQSQRAFARLMSTSCVVFYSKALEYLWECPTANVLLGKLRMRGWKGQVFVLKGPYLEFKSSYNLHIAGTRMTKEAQEYQQARSSTELNPNARLEAHDRYEAWLAQRDDSHTYGGNKPPDVNDGRLQAMDRQQQELAAEFASRFPNLYEKLRTGLSSSLATPSSGKDRMDDSKAQMVEYLDRGLDKIRASSSDRMVAGPSVTPTRSSSKMQDAYPDYASRPPSDDFVEVNKGDDDPGFQMLGRRATSVGDAEPKVPKKSRSGFFTRVLKRT